MAAHYERLNVQNERLHDAIDTQVDSERLHSIPEQIKELARRFEEFATAAKVERPI